MPLIVLVLLFRLVLAAIRAFREKTRSRGDKPEPPCIRCTYSQVLHGANARRAISCLFGGAVRPVELDVLYCTAFQSRYQPAHTRAIGFVREIAPAE